MANDSDIDELIMQIQGDSESARQLPHGFKLVADEAKQRLLELKKQWEREAKIEVWKSLDFGQLPKRYRDLCEISVAFNLKELQNE